MSRTAFGAALALVNGVWCWSDTLAPETAAESVALADFLPAFPQTARYGRRLIVIYADMLVDLDDATRREVLAILDRFGRRRLFPTPALDRARYQHRDGWTIPALQWLDAIRQPVAVAIAPEHALRVLQRAQAWQEAEEAAHRVEAAVGRTVALFYRIPEWHPYTTRAAQRWAVVEATIGIAYELESPAFLRCIELATAGLCPDFLLLDDVDAADWAAGIVHHVDRAGM